MFENGHCKLGASFMLCILAAAVYVVVLFHKSLPLAVHCLHFSTYRDLIWGDLQQLFLVATSCKTRLEYIR